MPVEVPQEAHHGFSPGYLTLEDGTRVDGYSFGANKPCCGELVFQTGMVGYPEALTDPSYTGQILILTYPLIGNYGVPDDTIEEEKLKGILKHFESSKIHVAGLIVSHYSERYSHYLAKQSLADYLRKHNVPALFGVDTRHLTKKIRTAGTLLAAISFVNDAVPAFKDPNKLNLVEQGKSDVCCCAFN